MNQALCDTTPTRWEDQGRHDAAADALQRRRSGCCCERVEEPTHATVDRPLGRKGEKADASTPRPPFSPNAPNLLRTVRRQPPRDPTTTSETLRGRPCAINLGQRAAGSTAATRQQAKAAGDSRLYLGHSQRRPHPTRQTADSSLARPAVTILPGKRGRVKESAVPRPRPPPGKRPLARAAIGTSSSPSVDTASARTPHPRPPHYRRQPTPGGRSSIPKSLADPQVGWGHVARHPPTTFPPMHHLSGTRDPLEPPTLKPHNSLNIHYNLRSAPSLRAGRAREAAAGCGKVAWQARTALRTFPSRGVSAPA